MNELSDAMTIEVRAATKDDAEALSGILNAIINAGGTTAHQSPFDASRMHRHYIAPDNLVCCSVAEIDGRIAGFQTLMWPDEMGQPFPKGWAVIASFVSLDAAGQGIGRALFAATKASALAASVHTIDATIRADNLGGLAYYQSLGFTDYDILRNVPLRDGNRVDRIRKKLAIT